MYVHFSFGPINVTYRTSTLVFAKFSTSDRHRARRCMDPTPTECAYRYTSYKVMRSALAVQSTIVIARSRATLWSYLLEGESMTNISHENHCTLPGPEGSLPQTRRPRISFSLHPPAAPHPLTFHRVRRLCIAVSSSYLITSLAPALLPCTAGIIES